MRIALTSFLLSTCIYVVVFCYLHGFVTWICLYLDGLLAVTDVMHETDDAYSIWSTWSWILSYFSIFHLIFLLFILLISVGVELPLCIAVTLS